MSADDATRAGFSLRRWSARKRAAAQPADGARVPDAPAETPVVPVAAGTVLAPASPQATARASAGASAPAAAEPDAGTALPVAPAELAPVETLTPQSDFTPYMRADVDPALKRAALRKLFTDPRFNVMDGLDVYIDDYSKPDPIAPEILRTLVQARYIFNPPVTRINAQGFVEDVPPDEAAIAGAKERTDEVAAADAADAADAATVGANAATVGDREATASDDTAPAGQDAAPPSEAAQLDLPLPPAPAPATRERE